MKTSRLGYLFMITALLFSGSLMYGQEEPQTLKLSVNQLFSLVEENNPSLKVSKAEIEIAKQDIKVAKNQKLPDIGFNASASYIGNAYILDKHFSKAATEKMPHFGNNFSVEATQLIWKDGVVRKSIQAKSLEEKLAELNHEANQQEVKLLILGYYLDLYKLQNEVEVYHKNIELAEKRFKNITQFYEEGMVTRNDLIRGELQISNLNLTREKLRNGIKNLNNQLIMALGLDENVEIVANESSFDEVLEVSFLELYQNNIENHPSLLMAKKAVDLYEVSEKIVRSERMPTLVAFAGSSLDRPITTTSPVLDMYSNGWSVGVALNFDFGSLYKTPKKIQSEKFKIEKAKAQADEAEKLLEVAVKAAYINYEEAVTQHQTLEKNTDLAAENYRIMESKYNHQLAILLDMIDASNTKLDAELQLTNSETNIIFAYYNLLRTSGLLQ